MLSDCEPMDGGVGLRVMWRNGENRGRINPLQCGGVYDTIAAGNGWKNDDYRGIGMSLKIHLKKSWYPKAGGVFARGFDPYLWGK